MHTDFPHELVHDFVLGNVFCFDFGSFSSSFFLFLVVCGRAIHYTYMYMQRKKPQVSNGRPSTAEAANYPHYSHQQFTGIQSDASEPDANLASSPSSQQASSSSSSTSHHGHLARQLALKTVKAMIRNDWTKCNDDIKQISGVCSSWLRGKDPSMTLAAFQSLWYLSRRRQGTLRTVWSCSCICQLRALCRCASTCLFSTDCLCELIHK